MNTFSYILECLNSIKHFTFSSIYFPLYCLVRKELHLKLNYILAFHQALRMYRWFFEVIFNHSICLRCLATTAPPFWATSAGTSASSSASPSSASSIWGRTPSCSPPLRAGSRRGRPRVKQCRRRCVKYKEIYRTYVFCHKNCNPRVTPSSQTVNKVPE